jgi:hypothetical protein
MLGSSSWMTYVPRGVKGTDDDDEEEEEEQNLRKLPVYNSLSVVPLH